MVPTGRGPEGIIAGIHGGIGFPPSRSSPLFKVIMMTEWFDFLGARFLIKGLNPRYILAIDQKVKAGELDEKRAMALLFKSILTGFKGIAGGRRLSRSKKIDGLFTDPEIRNFVLQKSMEILEREVVELARVGKVLSKMDFGLKWGVSLLKKGNWHGTDYKS